ncbi:hypothetical protein Clacol_001996 [Clathrus columnatus]|uniref:Protein BIG1 n=1 Tax=Clathrus columnatus TaxID=1419009 RepID=A0AAV5A5B4_9AGAM|nr:hypothetical protein Clacol_001996 [Clathrus columnatus]
MVRWLAAPSFFLVAAAYQDTVPIVAWSSKSSHDLSAVSSRPNPYSSPADLFHQLLQDNDICNFDVVIIADQPGLSAADLRTSSYLATQLSTATSSLQIPYLPSSSDNEPKAFESFKEGIVEKCGSERKEIPLSSRSGSRSLFIDGLKQVLGINMPPLDTLDGKQRRDIFMQSQSQLENAIKEQTASFSSHLVIYTSSHSARSELDKVESLHSLPIHADVAEAINSTLPTGSLFQRYQFFTPALLAGFFVGFIILLPILMLGVYAIASIQTPSRMDSVGSRTVSLDKKNQ